MSGGGPSNVCANGSCRSSTLLRVLPGEAYEYHGRTLGGFAHRKVKRIDLPALRGPFVQNPLELFVGDVARFDDLVADRHAASSALQRTPLQGTRRAATSFAP